MIALRNIDENKKAVLGPDFEVGDNRIGLVEEYFKIDTMDDYSSHNTMFSLPISMRGIFDQVISGDHKLLSTFVSHRTDNGANTAVLRSLKQKFLIVKLNYSGVEEELKQEPIKALWDSLEMEIDTSMLTEVGSEESKGDKKAELVGIVTKMKKDAGNNNQVLIRVDGNWHMFKTMIVLSTAYDTIVYENASKLYYPLILVYKIKSNFKQTKQEPKAEPAPKKEPAKKPPVGVNLESQNKKQDNLGQSKGIQRGNTHFFI